MSTCQYTVRQVKYKLIYHVKAILVQGSRFKIRVPSWGSRAVGYISTGAKSEFHPQVLFGYSTQAAWHALSQGKTLEMQPAHRLLQTSTRILMRLPWG